LNRHSDQDFETLNALADGELGETEAAAMQKRLRQEPDLKAAFDEINHVKRKLGAMGLGRAEEVAVAPPARIIPVSHPWAIAASVAAFAVVTAFLITQFSGSNTAPTGVLAWHDHLSQKEYVVTENQGPLFVSLGQSGDIPVPDLAPSKLYLVDTKVIGTEPNRQRAVMHYRGLRGCRLTLWYGSASAGYPIVPPAGNDGTFKSWTVGGGQFALIATGMDTQRFASIADYLEILTALTADDGSLGRTAMVDAYEKAVRCA
jgi:hypothetical protein